MTRRLTLMLLLPALLLVAGCGSSSDSGGKDASKQEQAFLRAMIPHHKSAIDMAGVAEKRAEHPQVKRLAKSIVADQAKEIAQMERIHQHLFRSAVRPNANAHEQLGLSPDKAGMAHMEGAMTLEKARPFDRAFIDEMIPHHQGAIRMARAVSEMSNEPEITKLAASIITAQSFEIDQMNSWRKRWYGAESPAGSVPKDSGASAMPGMDHGSH